MQSHLLAFLRMRGYASVLATSVGEALESLAHRSFRFTLLDLDLNGHDAAEVVQRLKLQGGDPGPVIGFSRGTNGRHELDSSLLAVDAVLDTPLAYGDLDRAIADILVTPERAAGQVQGGPPAAINKEIELWQSPSMREVRDIIGEAAGVDVTVLITGETGTGKEVVARAIHYLSTRRASPFVKVNCAAVPRELLESELFGHERGAFTGAHKLKIGKFEAAHHGTIFLDEIGDLHSSLQAKLLHVLHDGDFSRVGGKSTLKIDVRVLAATNQDLERAVAAGRFREDLYYRLNVIQIAVPPLRERTEEIPVLVDYFVQRYATIFRREGFTVPRSVMDRLTRLRYPGNVRELENLVKRMIVLDDPFLSRIPLPDAVADGPTARVAPSTPESLGPPQEPSLKEISRRASQAAEREAIAKTLELTGWNRVRAARALRISYRALLYKIKQAGLGAERPSARSAL